MIVKWRSQQPASSLGIGGHGEVTCQQVPDCVCVKQPQNLVHASSRDYPMLWGDPCWDLLCRAAPMMRCKMGPSSAQPRNQDSAR